MINVANKNLLQHKIFKKSSNYLPMLEASQLLLL